MAEATQEKLNLSAICHVGPGTGGGEMFRRYWLAISRAEGFDVIFERSGYVVLHRSGT